MYTRFIGEINPSTETPVKDKETCVQKGEEPSDYDVGLAPMKGKKERR